jgi:hypothetical protein
MLRSRGSRVVLVCLLLAALSGCDYITSALPPSPSPFPTLARLPTVTPVTPSPTPLPSPTLPPALPTLTPTPAILRGTVAVGANVRSGPSLEFEIITSLVAGSDIVLQGQSNGWYQVRIPDGTEGWMSEQVIEITPETATAVPTVAPETLTQ